MARDWRPEIVRMVQVKQALSEADLQGLWEFHLPRVAATAEDLKRVETALGVRLDSEYREFMTYADGWPAIFQSVDLFGTEDLIGGPRMMLAKQAVASLEASALGQSGLSGAQLLPIAATGVDLDIFLSPVVDGLQQPAVIWFAGSEVDRFATFRDFILAMLEYNTRELKMLGGR